MDDLSLRDPSRPTAAGHGTPPPGLRRSPRCQEMIFRDPERLAQASALGCHRASLKLEPAVVIYPVHLEAGSAVGPHESGHHYDRSSGLTPLNACPCPSISAPLPFDAAVGVIWFHSSRLKHFSCG